MIFSQKTKINFRENTKTEIFVSTLRGRCLTGHFLNSQLKHLLTPDTACHAAGGRLTSFLMLKSNLFQKTEHCQPRGRWITAHFSDTQVKLFLQLKIASHAVVWLLPNFFLFFF
jgi:hypothetical protein